MDKSPILNRLFRYALLSSVAFHALLFLIFADFSSSTVTNSSPATPVIAAHLLQPVQAAAAMSEIAVNASQPHRPIAIRRSEPSLEKVEAVQVAKPSSLSGSGLNSPSPSTNDAPVDSGAPLAKAEMPSLEAPDADDLRTYRLNLSREARRFKRYPAIARERGLEGIVVVVVSTRAGVTLPQVSLSQGSGETVLDQQALEMVNFAVRYALMPNSLRQRDFGIDLPIHFSLDE